MKNYFYHLAIAAALLAVPAVAQSQQDPYYGQDTYGQYSGGPVDPRAHGYQHGYRDGFHHAREDMAARASANYKTQDYDRGDIGYESYMGSHDQYKKGYREGYERGYNDAYSGRQAAGVVFGSPGYDPRARRDRDNDGDADDAYRPGNRNDDVYVQRNYGVNDVAYDIGYNDGIYYAQRDLARNKNYDPQGAKGYKDADHGYRSSYGDKDAFKRAYRNGFERGYQDEFGNRR